MSISKHSRKSGATTVMKDGKIVGNIGAGKTNTPTSHNNFTQKLDTTETDVSSTSTLADAQQKFNNLSPKTVSFEQAQVLWNLTAEQNLIERLNILGNYINNMLSSDRKKLLGEVEKQIKFSTMDIYLSSGSSRYGNLSPNILDACARYPKYDWRVAVARNKDATPETLDALVDLDDWLLKKTVAENPHTSPKTLENIFNKTRDVSTLCAIAENENTPVKILKKLSKNEQNSIRISVARNENIPTEILYLLSKDPSCSVKQGVAQNWNAPPDILDCLSQDSDTSIVWYVADNRNTSYTTLKKLTKNYDIDIANTAKTNPKYSQHAGRGGTNS